MKTAAVVGTGASVSAAAVAGMPVLAGLGALAVLLVGMLCWTVTNRARTSNLVAIIRAVRVPAGAARHVQRSPATGRRRRR